MLLLVFSLSSKQDIPLPTDSADRYVSAGSIEYWPEPQRGICEAYRVIKEGGRATIIGMILGEERRVGAHMRAHTHTHTIKMMAFSFYLSQAGPVHPTNPISAFFADLWMLFPTEKEV